MRFLSSLFLKKYEYVGQIHLSYYDEDGDVYIAFSFAAYVNPKNTKDRKVRCVYRGHGCSFPTNHEGYATVVFPWLSGTGGVESGLTEHSSWLIAHARSKGLGYDDRRCVFFPLVNREGNVIYMEHWKK